LRITKTTLVAPKADPVKQAQFMAQLNQQISQLPANEVVYFADAVHPQHNTRLAHAGPPVRVDRSRQVIDSVYYSEFSLFEQRIMAFRRELEPYGAQLEHLLVLKFALVNKEGLVAD
jgi:hypothetical protein